MNEHTPSRAVPGWVRLAMVALGTPNVIAGAWAVLAPQHWYDRFPGFDPRLIVADPPYNAHLATDAGAGLLASGFVLIAAAAWFADHRSVRLALLAYGVFAIPHAAWHTFNPSDSLSGAEDLRNAATLLLAAGATIGLYAVVARSRRPAPTPAGDQQEEVLA